MVAVIDDVVLLPELVVRTVAHGLHQPRLVLGGQPEWRGARANRKESKVDTAIRVHRVEPSLYCRVSGLATADRSAVERPIEESKFECPGIPNTLIPHVGHRIDRD